MTSLNRVQLIGVIADDPELRYTSKSEPVVSFIINVESEKIVNFDYVDNITISFPIIAWGELAKLCNEYLRKGNLVYRNVSMI